MSQLFLGQKRTHNKERKMNCRGVTASGLSCKNKGSCNGYCRYHIPTLYVKIANWPTFKDVTKGVRTCSTVWDMIGAMNAFTFEMQLNIMLGFEDQNKFEQRKCLIRTAEICKVNATLMYNEPALENLASIMASKLDTVPELKDYTEDFRRKCVKSHREEAKKKLMSFYFKRCEDLCDDMIWEILQRV